MLTTEQIRKIENNALDVLLDTFTDINSIVPPIDVYKIASKHDLTVKVGQFADKNVAGAYDKPGKAIYVAEDDHLYRKNFTVAHELGHFFLHKDRSADLFHRSDMENLEGDNKLDETEANWFAASLLMPEMLVRRFMTVFRNHWEIAELFGVSNSAAYYRLKNIK